MVDEEGRLLFHNARLRDILGYSKQELDLGDTRQHWHDLEHRTRIIADLRQRGGQLLNDAGGRLAPGERRLMMPGKLSTYCSVSASRS